MMEIITALASLSALVISIAAWKSSRAIHEIEVKVLRQPTGGHDDMHDGRTEINRLLASGNYSVLNVSERRADGDWSVLLGKLSTNNPWVSLLSICSLRRFIVCCSIVLLIIVGLIYGLAYYPARQIIGSGNLQIAQQEHEWDRKDSALDIKLFLVNKSNRDLDGKVKFEIVFSTYVVDGGWIKGFADLAKDLNNNEVLALFQERDLTPKALALHAYFKRGRKHLPGHDDEYVQSPVPVDAFKLSFTKHVHIESGGVQIVTHRQIVPPMEAGYKPKVSINAGK